MSHVSTVLISGFMLYQPQIPIWYNINIFPRKLTRIYGILWFVWLDVITRFLPVVPSTIATATTIPQSYRAIHLHRKSLFVGHVGNYVYISQIIFFF